MLIIILIILFFLYIYSHTPRKTRVLYIFMPDLKKINNIKINYWYTLEFILYDNIVLCKYTKIDG